MHWLGWVFGTLLGVVQIVILLLPPLRPTG